MRPLDRLQPSLLDRLTDDEPGSEKEAREKRVLTSSQLRDAVKRDLAWLLNTTHLETVQDLDEYPAVRASTLNYGLPDLTGQVVAGLSRQQLEAYVKEAILAFEPRILHDSLRVTAEVDHGDGSRRAVSLVIEGELWAEPVPLHLLLRSEVEIDTGHVRVEESTAQGRT